MRKCKTCGVEKPIETFPKYHAKGLIGRRGTCRDCWNAKWTPIIVAHGRRYYHENTHGYRDKQKARTMLQHRADKGAHRRRNVAYSDRHPLKAAAKQSVTVAVRSGRLSRRACQVCGMSKTQAHHDDYSKPFVVLWLCLVHHGERHRLLNRRTPSEHWPSEWPDDLRVRDFPKKAWIDWRPKS